MRRARLAAWAVLAVLPMMVAPVLYSAASAQVPAPNPPPPGPAPEIAPSLPPDYVVDLMTPEGVAAFGAQWRNMEAKIVENPALPDAMPGYKTSYDIAPHAGEKGFNDSAWPVLQPKELGDHRGGGKVGFTWYRANLTIPAKIGNFDTAGAKAVFTVLVDDYAEVWVNGEMPRAAGRPSPGGIQGFNMPNRVVLGDAVKPGDKFQVAVFGINGPISVAPANFIFVREARVEFYR
jgi:gluconolactonase